MPSANACVCMIIQSYNTPASPVAEDRYLKKHSKYLGKIIWPAVNSKSFFSDTNEHRHICVFNRNHTSQRLYPKTLTRTILVNCTNFLCPWQLFLIQKRHRPLDPFNKIAQYIPSYYTQPNGYQLRKKVKS